MRFLEPSMLAWAATLLGVLALYLFRRRPRKLVVSSLAFFKSLSVAHQESPWLRFLKKLLAFLLSVALVLCAVGWLAKLTPGAGRTDFRTVIVLVDRSASMSVRAEPDGPDRLEGARRLARQRLAAVPESVGVVVIAYDARPEVLLGRTFDRHAVHDALSALAPLPVGGDPLRALALAQSLADLERPSVIWHLTDRADTADSAPAAYTDSFGGEERSPADASGTPEPLSPAPPELAAQVVPLMSPLPGARNAGITAFHLRRLPLEHGRYEAFIQIEGVCEHSEDAELEIRMDGRLAGIRKVPVATGARERIILPFAGAECALLDLTVRFPGDMMPFDDRVLIPIPATKPIRVAWVTETPEPYTELVLRALAGAEMDIVRLAPGEWPPKELPDVAVFDRAESAPEGLTCATVLLNPAATFGSVAIAPIGGAGLPVERFRVTDYAHPILYGVANERLAVTQTAVFPSAGALEPLWISPAGPFLCAGEMGGRRVVAMGFSSLASERLVLTASYPLLLGNAIIWAAAESLARLDGQHLRSGTLFDARETSFQWTQRLCASPDAPEPGTGWLTLRGIGSWRTEDGRVGSSSLLDRSETLLAASGGDEERDAAAAAWPDLKRMLLWCLALLVAFEFWLFHRHAVY